MIRMADQGDQRAEETDPVKIQEGLLRKALTLKGNIDSFLKQLESAPPLPPYPAIFARLTALRDAVDQFTTEAHEKNDLLSTIVVVPNGQFPAKYHMELISTLLRTKMEPFVEDWEHQHLTAAHDRENKLDLEKKRGIMTSLSEADRAELWDWAAEAAQNELQKHVWFEADYTMAEKEDGIENVNHGLKRELIVPELKDPDFEDDDDELFEDIKEDKQDEMDVDLTLPDNDKFANSVPAVISKPIATDKLHRFMMRGEAA